MPKLSERERWKRRIEGQIRDCMKQHPDYFNWRRIEACHRSLTKRILGEVMAGLAADRRRARPERAEASQD